jgi:hypothetical protein
VCLSEIIDVNVVSNACAVGGRVVGSEDLQFRSRAGCSSKRKRYEVSLRFVEFADVSALVRSGRVEIAQARKT